MNVFKEKFLAKVEKNGNKKSIENLVVFVIILIATIIFINYIWNGNKKEIKEEKSSVLADTTVNNNITEKNNNLESQIGVGNALDRAKNTIARTRLQFEQRKLKSDLSKYQKQEKMIERLKSKRGMCRLSEQFYRQVVMSYAM